MNNDKQKMFQLLSKIDHTYKMKLNENDDNVNNNEFPEYDDKLDKIKNAISSLADDLDFEAIDVLYNLLVDRKHKINEDDSTKHEIKVDKINSKLDYLFSNDNYDVIDRIYDFIDKLVTLEIPNENE